MRVEMDCVIIGICDGCLGMGIVMIELVIVQNRVTVISAKIINYKLPIDQKSRRDSDKRRIFNLVDVEGGPRDVGSKIIYYRYI